jgi:hypothetical protein
LLEVSAQIAQIISLIFIMSHNFQNGECTQCGELKGNLVRDPQTGRLPNCPDTPIVAGIVFIKFPPY